MMKNFLILGPCAAVWGYYVLRKSEKIQLSWTNSEYNETIGSSVQLVPRTPWNKNWDFQEPEMMVSPKESNEKRAEQNEKQKKAHVARHVILIRHGQYNLNGRIDSERTLTELGIEQAKRTGQRLRELDVPIDVLVKSTMTRAQQTGDLILKELQYNGEIRNCNLVEEGSPIPPEPEVHSWKPPQYKFFKDQPRIEAAFRKYFYRPSVDQEKDSYTVLVCHGNVIRYFLCRALQFPPEAWLRLSINNGSITTLTIGSSGRVILKNYNDTGYMSPDMLTTN